jgi:hypothetical protein
MAIMLGSSLCGLAVAVGSLFLEVLSFWFRVRTCNATRSPLVADSCPEAHMVVEDEDAGGRLAICTENFRALGGLGRGCAAA